MDNLFYLAFCLYVILTCVALLKFRKQIALLKDRCEQIAQQQKEDGEQIRALTKTYIDTNTAAVDVFLNHDKRIAALESPALAESGERESEGA